MKKLLTLFTLVLLGMGSAWAQTETLFSAMVAATSNQSFTGSADGVTTELTSSQATVTGGKMYVVTYQTSSKDLIAAQSGKYYFTMTNNNTYFNIVIFGKIILFSVKFYTL